jgi:sugar/nucleoside kinase (ribokinase family)
VRADLVTAGEAFEDFVFYDLPRLPRPGEEVKTSHFAHAPGGGAIITAIAAARLGVRTAVVSAVSSDTRTRLRRERVGFRDLRRADEDPAITVALSTARDRSFITFNGVNDRLEERLLSAVPRVSARHVHCAFYPKRCRRWIPVVRRLRQRGRTISWDFGWNERLNDDPGFTGLLAELSVVFVNEAEARLYADVPSLPAAFTWWRNAARATVVKLGSRGAVYLTERAVIRSPAPRARAVDTTGAGDAFNGGYLAGYVRGKDVGACLRLANAVGARATTKPGGLDGLPTRNELR